MPTTPIEQPASIQWPDGSYERCVVIGTRTDEQDVQRYIVRRPRYQNEVIEVRMEWTTIDKN